MPENVGEGAGDLGHPTVRYERADVNSGAVFAIVIGSVVFGGIILFVIWVFFLQHRDYEREIKRSHFPLAPTPSTALPPQPRLEQIDRIASRQEDGDPYKRQLEQEQILKSYGNTDEAGYIRVPIDRAIRVLDGKLPARAEPPAAQNRREDGLVTGGESNSGRLFRGKPRWFEP
jgi:hypothetical protein